MSEREFHRLWIPLQERFYRVAYHFLENREDAEDIVQDLYVKLWNMRDILELVQSPASYGCLLTRNLCIDRLRKLEGNEQGHGGIQAESVADYLPSSPPPDSAMTATEGLQALMRAIDQLPPGQGRVLKMRVFQGKKNSEIAAATGLSEMNVRVHMSLARSRIKKLLRL